MSMRRMPVLPALLVTLFALGPRSSAQTPLTLIVNGTDMGSTALGLRGRTYADIEVLVTALNGSVSMESDRVILRLPGELLGLHPQAESISREFASSGLNAIGLLRDWKVAVETMIRFQSPVDNSYFQELQYRAEEGLRQIALMASTGPDRQAYQLIESGHAILMKWATAAIATRERLDATRTTNPDYLRNNTELQKINECGRALASMLASRQFADIYSCH